MDTNHLHLILNHLPATGLVVALAVFCLGWLRRNHEFQRLAIGLLVVFALTAIPVYLTGGSAEETVSRMPGVSKTMIEAHEEAAGISFATMEVLGALGSLGLILFRKTPAIPKAFAAGLLVLALSTTGLFAWTGYLGGQIRHPEIRAGSPWISPLHAGGRWWAPKQSDD